ncbi:MAG: hypothetical protein AB1458_15395 [Bacteroidota bacterium]
MLYISADEQQNLRELIRMIHQEFPESRSRDEQARRSAQTDGLCGNCDKAGRCTFFKPGKGVWDCEEYE